MNDDLKKAAEVCGFQISGTLNGEMVVSDSPPGAEVALKAIAAAQGRSFSEVSKTLPTAIAAERWTAYVAVRNSVAQAKRAARYAAETDPMLHRGLEDPNWLGSETHKAWVDTKKKIRDEVPNWSDGGE